MLKNNLILRTKLILPKIKSGILNRKRLLNILKKSLDKKLILICGDAGYGKTTLLVQFCGMLKHPFVFYSLEPSDNDITTFFSYIIAGIRHSYKGFGGRTERILGQTQNIEILVGTFINEIIEKVKEDFYIVLDDYHHLQMNKGITGTLDYLLQHQPSNMHLVISSRATPPLDLSHYLAKQELTRLEKEHLQFKYQEVKRLLEESYELNISETEMERVVEHSEGWITAIQLILQNISTIGESKTKETLNGYVASGEELFNYFAREVFEHQPKKIQKFLLKTSFLKRMDPNICNYLLDIRNSKSVFKKFENEHIFISRVGDMIYKYHPLFQKFVNDIAHKTYSNKVIRSLYAKIANTYIKDDNLEQAIDYYIKGNQYKRAITIIKKVSRDFILSCRFNRLVQWFRALPETYLEDDLRLMNIKADILWHTTQIEESLDLFKHIIRLARKKKDNDNLFDAYYGAAKVYANTGNFELVQNLMKKCYKIPSVKQKKLVDAYNLEGISYVYLNNFKKAEARFEKALKILGKYGGLEQHSSLMNNMAIVAFTKGELETSLKIFKKLIKSKINIVSQPQINTNIAITLLGLGHLKEARTYLKQAYIISKQYMNMRGQFDFLLGLGFYYLEQNNYTKAEIYFRRLMTTSGNLNLRLYEQKAKHGLAKTLYLAGRTTAAMTLADEMLKEENIRLGIRHHDGFLLRGLIQADLHDYKGAENTLLQCLTAVEGTDFKYSLMRNYYYLAYLYLMMKNEKKAVYYLRPALKLAKENKYDHFLISTSIKIIAPLEFAIQRGIEEQYAESLIARIMSGSKIEVNLFGSFEVSIQDKMIAQAQWQTRKAQLIFAYLMVYRNRSIPKEDLMDKFSTQNKPTLANQDIRTTVSRTQKALRWKKFISYERGFYKVNKLLNVSLDTEAFERYAKHIIQNKDNLDKVSLEHANRALVLYRDDFLVSFYEEWCDEMRLYFRNLYFNMLNILGEYFLGLEKKANALSFFQKILEKDQLNEMGNSGVIKSLLAMGKKPQAVKQYAAYKTRLKKQLNLEPSKKFVEFTTN